MPLSLATTLQINMLYTALEGSSTTTDAFPFTSRPAWVDGTGALGASKQWNDYRTLGGSADSLDLAGSLVNRAGVAAVFSKVRFLIARCPSTNAGAVTLGGGSNAFNTAFGILIVRPGGWAALAAVDATGYAVTAGTGDLLQVAGTSGDSYEVLISGE